MISPPSVPRARRFRAWRRMRPGPLSFMDVWDAMCRTIMSAGSRRGAMMATMRCDHPDIEDFIAAKADAARLRMFNVSVLATDPFMEAVKADGPWELTFGGRSTRPARARPVEPDHARDLRLCRAGRDLHRPDQRREQPWLRETIAATNPCGEQPLAALWRVPAGLDQPRPAGDGAVRARARLDAAALAELSPPRCG
jgi:ribonucleoside-diphosphate reductase alpha chain